jgi:hypothetical protein
MGFKVLKTINPVQWGTKPSDTDIVYMRVPCPNIDFMRRSILVIHQYYRIVNGVPYLCEAVEEELTLDSFNQLASILLTSEENNLNTDSMHEAFYKGSLYIIAQKQKYNTGSEDWEILDVPEEDDDYSMHTAQVLM